MSTAWTFDGEVRIEPPLNFSQIKRFRRACFEGLSSHDTKRVGRSSDEEETGFPMNDFYSLVLDIEEDEEETDRGRLLVFRAPVLRPSYSQMRMSSYTMVDQVELAISLFPDHAFSGEIIAVREENTAALKVTVKDNKATEVKGTLHIVWDDGSQSTSTADL
jgi:hypothetical protein